MLTNNTLMATVSGAWHNPVVFGVRRMFYLCTPGESSFSSIQQVPQYVDQAVPYFFAFVMLETLLLIVQGRWKRTMRMNDAISSLGAGVISILPMLFVRNIEMSAYIYVHEKFNITQLPWDSASTWWLTMLGMDLGYYWVHRCAHEVNFMWAAHQVHHSSEDYNLTTALRQSLLQRYTSWMFYLPMALFLPPQIFMVHVQLNLIGQFWIHTECIGRLPAVLEYFINTPSHHRVHHGRNRYCIDKNYAGVLIIWDRIFGTFVPEKDDDDIAYGLVHPLTSWDPIYTQICHWKYIMQTAWNMPGLGNKISVFVKGPGWTPGKPRLGEITDIPDIHGPQKRYNKSLSVVLRIYIGVHFLSVLLGQQMLAMHKSEFHVLVVFFGMIALLWTLSNIGLFFEHKWYAPYSELARCVVYLYLDSTLCSGDTCRPSLYFPRVLFMMSSAMCLILLLNQMKTTKKKIT